MERARAAGAPDLLQFRKVMQTTFLMKLVHKLVSVLLSPQHSSRPVLEIVNAQLLRGFEHWYGAALVAAATFGARVG